VDVVALYQTIAARPEDTDVDRVYEGAKGALLAAAVRFAADRDLAALLAAAEAFDAAPVPGYDV
jgi:hypothetical protein